MEVPRERCTAWAARYGNGHGGTASYLSTASAGRWDNVPVAWGPNCLGRLLGRRTAHILPNAARPTPARRAGAAARGGRRQLPLGCLPRGAAGSCRTAGPWRVGTVLGSGASLTPGARCPVGVTPTTSPLRYLAPLATTEPCCCALGRCAGVTRGLHSIHREAATPCHLKTPFPPATTEPCAVRANAV